MLPKSEAVGPLGRRGKGGGTPAPGARQSGKGETMGNTGNKLFMPTLLTMGGKIEL